MVIQPMAINEGFRMRAAKIALIVAHVVLEESILMAMDEMNWPWVTLPSTTLFTVLDMIDSFAFSRERRRSPVGRSSPRRSSKNVLVHDTEPMRSERMDHLSSRLSEG